MKEPDQSAILRGVATVAFRHQRKAIWFFLAVVVSSALYLLLAPRQYESTAKLFMRVGRQSIALDPTATVGQTMMVQKTHESEINSALDILTSRGVATKVVQAVGPREVLELDGTTGIIGRVKGAMVKSLKTAFDALQPRNDGGPTDANTALEDKAVLKIQGSTRVWAPKESMVITISCRAGSPQLAQRLCQTVTDVFLDEHVRVNHASGSYAFFKTQTEQIREELKQAQEELRDRKKEYGLVTVAGKQQVLQDRLRDIQLAALQTARLAAASRTKITDLEVLLADIPKEVVTQFETGYPNEARDEMRAKLYELEIRELQQPFAEVHPLAQALKAQREKALAIISSENRERTQETTGLNPVHLALDTEKRTQAVELAALDTQSAVLRQQAEQLQRDLLELNDQQAEIERLEREARLSEKSYLAHMDKFEQARIDAALESRRISNINVLQPATYIAKAVSPVKSLVLLGAVLFGCCGAAGLAAVCEYFDSSLRSEEQVEAVLQLPVVLALDGDARVESLLRQRAVGN